jgi:hypothetical protein
VPVVPVPEYIPVGVTDVAVSPGVVTVRIPINEKKTILSSIPNANGTTKLQTYCQIKSACFTEYGI